MSWRLAARCKGMNPAIFDEGGREAAAVCELCPVIAECADDALQPINISMILRRRMNTHLDEPDDVVHQSGVFRAGVQM